MYLVGVPRKIRRFTKKNRLKVQCGLNHTMNNSSAIITGSSRKRPSAIGGQRTELVTNRYTDMILGLLRWPIVYAINLLQFVIRQRRGKLKKDIAEINFNKNVKKK